MVEEATTPPRQRPHTLGDDSFQDMGSAIEAAVAAGDGNTTDAPAQERTGIRVSKGVPSLATLSLVACPHLGLAADPPTHYAVPEDGHCCFGLTRRAHIPKSYQSEWCLAANYTACKVFSAVQRGEEPALAWERRPRRKRGGLLAGLFRRR